MTIFIASLFLPKTVYFKLPDAPPKGGRLNRETTGAGPVAKTRPSLAVRPSLFAPGPVVTPPDTPTEENNVVVIDDGPFANEDGARIQLPGDYSSSDSISSSDSSIDFGPADKESPKWGSRSNQPKSRANSPPPSSLLERTRIVQKAKEMGRQGVTQPRTNRSDSHDRVFASANWRIVNADQGNGGLRNAADAAARDGYEEEHTWIGTLGMPTDALEGTQQKEDIHDKLWTEHNMLAVFCSDKDFDGHYSHFCKQILWPVFHYQMPDNPKSKAYEDHSWQFYVNVNQAFADRIVQNWKRGDTVWVHDYHLLLVPGMVRKKLPDAKIGLFLHVAFPSSELFRCLAVRKQLLEGMLGANLIGFQIHEYTRHFLQTCSRLLSVEATPDGIQLDERFVNVMNHAIGIDPLNLNTHREDQEVRKWINIMKERYQDKKIIVARDKLDHVRGVREKLLSYELFLNKNPEWRDKIVLIQVALSTSEKTDLDAAVGDIVTRVNSSWASLAYQPLVYLKQDIPYSQYLALLTIADALMITSQREGMNLTSHEFLVCQDGKHDEKKHGSLILSEFTGTSSLFGGNELSINPWSHRQCSEAIKKAIEMSDEEKELRWEKLHGAVKHHTGGHWFAEFMAQLNRAYDEQHRHDQTSVPRLNMPALSSRYSKSQRRLFFLDLEGTLIPYNPMSSMIPMNPQRTLAVLNDLVADGRNSVYVMSGRRPAELDRLFRLVPNLGLIAENGCFVKNSESSRWTEIADHELVTAWKESVKNILQYYLERTPGAEIEDRQCSLVFHYKNAEDYANAERQATDWIGHINESCEKQRVHAMQLEDCVVVEPIDWTKETAAVKVYNDLTKSTTAADKIDPVDFVMVMGDGREDEKVFKWANGLADKAEVVTVSLGNRNTEASATLTQGVSGVLVALQKLASLS
ncbi:family 20 glycosyltransferase [Pseudomassariella vexata]|uniref:Family 20 glycosyltransferase n=1 Tax=Pseudomassariella vexata TaxID=1141098 RepID=A0A1Y2E5E7_9PEZI|nr:family 20 glycosyltransferase [Pseudomassariella vexata]ORY66085.1 family 20 glycosyltransferase [Pseudomassariella vexata]